MLQHRKAVFDVVRPWLDKLGYTDERIAALNGALASAGVPEDQEAPPQAVAPVVPPTAAGDRINVRVALEILSHESLVLESYKDSVGVWTWGGGVTDASGHAVARYKDNPQPIEHVLAIYAWLLRTKYLPAVLKAFEGFPLSDAQLAAALSFHYNTGAISRASWVRLAKAGSTTAAKAAMMEWRKPVEIIERREKELDLFFDGKWSQDGKTNIYPVRKPSYTPHWGGVRRVDITAEMRAALGAA
jgi:lysozyme